MMKFIWNIEIEKLLTFKWIKSNGNEYKCTGVV